MPKPSNAVALVGPQGRFESRGQAGICSLCSAKQSREVDQTLVIRHDLDIGFGYQPNKGQPITLKARIQTATGHQEARTFEDRKVGSMHQPSLDTGKTALPKIKGSCPVEVMPFSGECRPKQDGP